jgi:hypothetical protein
MMGGPIMTSVPGGSPMGPMGGPPVSSGQMMGNGRPGNGSMASMINNPMNMPQGKFFGNFETLHRFHCGVLQVSKSPTKI